MATMLPFTPTQFFAVFAAYNAAIWPIEIAAYGLGMLAAWLLVRPSPQGGRVISAVLAAMWLWTGVDYFWIYFSQINPFAWLFGAAFVVEGAILAFDGLVGRRLTFVLRSCARRISGVILIAYAGLIYPLLGIALGHLAASLPMFGVTPCPVTIFTLGLLLLSNGTTPWRVLIIPLLWSLVGGSAAFLLDVPQDAALLAGGIGCVLLFAIEPQRSALRERQLS
jgi:hypothetical protein